MPRASLALTLIVLLLAPLATASAAPPAFDIRGTWSGVAGADGATGTITWDSENCTTGAISGRGSGGGDTWPASGTIDGTSVSLRFGPYDRDKTYTATGSGTYDGSSRISGTFHDTETYKTQAGTFQFTRTSGPPQDGKGCVAKRPAAVQVICNYAVATSIDTCTATVADATGGKTPPTGTVTFKKATGSFTLGDTCTLKVSAGAPSTAICSVFYQAPIGSVTFPKVTATYNGDATFASASASTTFIDLVSGPIEATTPDPGTVQAQTQVPADGTTVEACVTVAAASTASGTPDLGRLMGRINALLKDLKSGPPSNVVATTNKLQALVDQVAAGLAANDARIQTLNASGTPADLAEIQRLTKQSNALYSTISEVLKAEHEACKAAIANMKSLATTAASRSSGTRLGYVRIARAKHGALRLKLKLNLAALRRAAGRRSRVTVYLRVNMVLPSGLRKGGWPRTKVQRIVLTRDGRRVKA